MNPYTQNAVERGARSRIVVDLADELIAEVDAWGVPAGMRSRADAIRNLLRKGLDGEQQPTTQK
uniref:Ribbon-helix-helix protein CopG domain-containing protein n=1 Tax=Alloyangia mangrovi TaxID=1779329 RepID=A0A2A3K152_9RHOB